MTDATLSKVDHEKGHASGRKMLRGVVRLVFLLLCSRTPTMVCLSHQTRKARQQSSPKVAQKYALRGSLRKTYFWTSLLTCFMNTRALVAVPLCRYCSVAPRQLAIRRRVWISNLHIVALSSRCSWIVID